MKSLKIAGLLIISMLIAIPVYVKTQVSVSQQELALFGGNASYIKKSDDTFRKELSKGQKPYAIVVACSDSRVAPEIIFNETLGKIFVIRTAGNVVDPITIGSIEYAVEHLKTPLIVVLGHQSCGAVKAAIESKGHAEGNIGEIIKKIVPAVNQVKKSAKGDENIEYKVITQNVKNVIDNIKSKSKIVSEEEKHGKVQIIGAYYSIESGKVDKL